MQRKRTQKKRMQIKPTLYNKLTLNVNCLYLKNQQTEAATRAVL